MSNKQKITTDIKVPNKDLETLKIHFPHCFDKDGNFQLEKFKNNLTEKEINFSTESYGLDWLGKSYARLLASDPATTLLKADETHNAKTENANSENLLIKGDNLEVLKHLANAYYEKIKMIYIDPPYNTGSDGFVYNDDRKYTVKELQNLIGIDEEKAKRILDFTQSKSNSHSAWLTFMYPRLYIAKQLLKDDGVIFISIDDNEVAQLRLLMDEIFGEENFVGHFLKQSKVGGGSDSRHIVKEHEYAIVFAKNILLLPDMFISHDEKYLKRYSEEDDKGRYFWDTFARPGLANPIHYDIEMPDGTILNKGWIHSKERFEEELKNGEIKIYQKSNGEWSIQFKQYLNLKGKKPRSMTMDFGGTIEGKNEIRKLFDDDKIFSYPKSITFIKKLLQIATNSNDIILDFFAGSGTTAHSVMQLNKEDGGNRKFILVQLPEPIDPKKNKTAYDFVKNELKAEPTIFEITKERLLRAAKKINAGLDEKIKKLQSEIPTEETKAEIAKLERLKQQNTFKIFETTPIWEDYNFEAEQFDSSQTLFDVGKLSEDDIKALLITWKTYDGIALTQDLESIDLSGYTAYYGNGRLYLMHKGFTTNNLKALLEKIDSDKHFEPKSIIAFGYHFESKSLREISENVKTYNNKKKSDIDFITRY